MADVQQTYRFKFEFNRKDIKKQLKEISVDVQDAIAQIGDASDKVVIFKDLVSYLSNVDKALDAFKNKHKDEFNNLFGNPDKEILGVLTEIFNTTQKSAQAFVTLKDKIAAAESGKADLKTLRSIAEEINELFVSVGHAPQIDISAMFSGKGSKANGTDFVGRIKLLKDSLDEFGVTYAGVQNKLKGGFNFGGISGGKGFGGNIVSDLDKLKKVVKTKVKEFYDELTIGSNNDDKLDAIQDSLKEALNFSDREFVDVSGVFGDLLYGDIDEDEAIDAINTIVEAVKSGAQTVQTVLNDTLDENIVNKNTNKSIQLLKQQLETIRDAGRQIGDKELGFAIDTDGATYFIESCDNMVKASDEAAVAVRALNENLTIMGHTHPDGGGQFSADDYISMINQRRSGVASPAVVIGDKYASVLNLANATNDVLTQIENVLIRHGKKGGDAVGASIISEMQEIFSANGMPDALQVIRIADGMDELAETLYKVGNAASVSQTPLKQLQSLINYYSGGKLLNNGLSSFDDYWNDFENGAKNAADVFDEVMAKLGATGPDGTPFNTRSVQYQAIGAALKGINSAASGTGSGDVNSADVRAAEEAAEAAQKRAEEAEYDALRYQEAAERLFEEKFTLERENDNLREQIKTQTNIDAKTQLAQAEVSQLEVLHQKLLEVKAAVDAKTQAFEEEYITVDAAVDAEIVSLQNLIQQLDNILTKVGLVETSIKQIGDNSVQLNVSESEEQLASLLTSSDILTEMDQLDKLQSQVVTLKEAILSKTKAFVDEGNVVGQVVGKEISALMKLEGIVNNIATKINTLVQNITELNRRGINLLQNDDTITDVPKTPAEQFKADKTAQKSSLTKYRNSLKDVGYITDQTRDKLAQMQAELDNIQTPLGLKQFAADLENIKKEIALDKNAFEITNFSSLNNAKSNILNSFNSLTLDQQKELKSERDEAIKQLEQYRIEVQNGHSVELDAIDAVVGALRQKIETYKTANKEAQNAVNMQKKNSKFGDTASINAQAKYNTLIEVARRDQFNGSQEVASYLDAYKRSYQEMIDKRDKLRAKDEDITDDDKEEFKRATTECNNYAKALEKLLNNTLKAHDSRINSTPYMLGADFNYNDIEARKTALSDFAKEMYGVAIGTEHLDDNYSKAMFEIKNSDGTITKITASFTEARNEIVAMAGDSKKSIGLMGQLWDQYKGKVKSIFSYFLATISVYDVWRVIKQGVGYVKEIDSALTELKKVTDETDASYNKFLKNMAKTGSVIGATVKDLTTMAAEWARLGYTLEDSAKLAESTAVLLNVSEFQDATAASEALISTMQAFQYTADDSMHVVDVLNEVGKFIARR